MKRATAAVFALYALRVAAASPQVWTQTDAAERLYGGFTAMLSEENRTGIKDGWHFDEIHVAPSVSWAANEWLDFAANYRHVLLRDGSDARWIQDRRPGADVRFHSDNALGHGLGLSNRSRFVLRDKEGEAAHFRWRNLSRVDSPWTMDKDGWAVRPFAAYEFYYDANHALRKADRFNIQWLTFGLAFRPLAWLRAEVFYRLVENKAADTGAWQCGHVVGLAATAMF